jgi:hypothetical protein
VVLVAEQLGEIQRARVVEALPRLAKQEGLGVEAGPGLGIELGQHGGLGRRQRAVQPAQHREGQDDVAVLALLVVAAQRVGDGPDE